MNKLEMLSKPAGGQKGMALISALMLLLVISLLAVGLSMDTNMDVRGASYQRVKMQAFGTTEAGLMVASDILGENADVSGWTNPSPPNPFTFPVLSPQYDDVIPGTINILQDGAFYLDNNVNELPIIEMTGEIEAVIVTQRGVAKLSTDAANQVAAGYAGVGHGLSGGGGHVVFDIAAVGHNVGGGSGNSRADLALSYRYVP